MLFHIFTGETRNSCFFVFSTVQQFCLSKIFSRRPLYQIDLESIMLVALFIVYKGKALPSCRPYVGPYVQAYLGPTGIART